MTPHPNGSTTYTIYTGPVREFALTVGDFVRESTLAGITNDVAVNVYKARGSSLDAKRIAAVAAHALTNFERRFGLYPYRELDIHLLPDDFDGGWEHPGMIYLSSNGQVDIGTRYVTAHEVAHQWWYAVIGNDIYEAPWLDESFAQHHRYGIATRQDVQKSFEHVSNRQLGNLFDEWLFH